MFTQHYFNLKTKILYPSKIKDEDIEVSINIQKFLNYINISSDDFKMCSALNDPACVDNMMTNEVESLCLGVT